MRGERCKCTTYISTQKILHVYVFVNTCKVSLREQIFELVPFQSCKPLPETEPEFPNSEGDEDYNYDNYGDFTLKSGASGNTCTGGKVCCELKEESKVEEPKVEEIVCTSMGNYQCLPSDVSDICLINYFKNLVFFVCSNVELMILVK